MGTINDLTWRAVGVIPHTNSDPFNASQNFGDILKQRRSIRRQGVPNTGRVLDIVRYVFRNRSHEGESARRLKLSMSAGALHPVHVIVIRRNAITKPVVYDDEHDVYLELAISDEIRLKAFITSLNDILPDAKGDILLFVGDSFRAELSYENSESLLWRDAGCILQTVAIVATASELVFCPYGLLGHDAVVAVFGVQNRLVPLGVAAIGVSRD